jgi:cell division control protein 6
MSLLINPAILEQTFLPRKLLFREEQHQFLADCIKPLFERRSGTNLIITGPPGIGKTASVKYMFRELIEKTDNIMPIYVNCWKRDTTPKIINEIARKMNLKLIEKMASDEIFDRLMEKFSKFDGIVFAFDEFDKVKDFDFLYRILEDVPYKTILLITNISDIVTKMDRRLMSRLLLERVNFKPYNFNETKSILHERQQYSFSPDSWDYDAFETIIRKTYDARDIRTGLFLMKAAGEIATKRDAPKINADDVNKSIEKLKDFYSKTEIGKFV